MKKQRERERKWRERYSPNCWLTTHIAKMIRFGLAKPRSQPHPSLIHGWQETNTWEVSPVAFPTQFSERWIKSGITRTQNGTCTEYWQSQAAALPTRPQHWPNCPQNFKLCIVWLLVISLIIMWFNGKMTFTYIEAPLLIICYINDLEDVVSHLLTSV